MTTATAIHFGKVSGALDRLDAADEHGQWWTVAREGSRWKVIRPDGSYLPGSGEPSKARAIDAAKIAMEGGHVEPPAPRAPSAPVPVSAEEKRHRATVRALGCIVADGSCSGAIEYAHVKPRQDGRGIPLCAGHHRTGGPGVAFHAGERTFAERYAPEGDLLAMVEERLAAAVTTNG